MRDAIRAHSARPRYDDDFDDLPRRSAPKKKGMSTGMILVIIFGSLAAIGCVICSGVGVLGYIGFVKTKEAVEDIKQQINAGRLPEGKGKILLSQQARL